MTTDAAAADPTLDPALDALITRFVGAIQAGDVAQMPAPTLGQHTEAILREAGFDETHIQKLRDLSVI